MNENSFLNFSARKEHEWGMIDNQIKNDYLGSKQQVYQGYNVPYTNEAVNNYQYSKASMDWALQNMKKEPTGASCSYSSASAISEPNKVYSSGTGDSNYAIVNPYNSSEKVENIAKSNNYTDYDKSKNSVDINGKPLYKKEWNNHQNTEVDVPVVKDETKGYMAGLASACPHNNHRKRKRESKNAPQYNYQNFNYLNNQNTPYNAHWLQQQQLLQQQQMMMPDTIYNPHVIQDLLQQQQMMYQQQHYLQQKNNDVYGNPNYQQWQQFSNILAVAQMIPYPTQQVAQPVATVQPIQQTIPSKKVERRKQRAPQLVEQIKEEPIVVEDTNEENFTILQQPLVPKLTVPAQNVEARQRKQKKPKADIPSGNLSEYPVDLNQNADRNMLQDWLLVQQQSVSEKPITTGWTNEHVYNN